MLELRLDAANVIQPVGTDKGVTASLALRLAVYFQINKQAHARQCVAAARQGGVVGDLEEFNHGVAQIMTAGHGAIRGWKTSIPLQQR